MSASSRFNSHELELLIDNPYKRMASRRSCVPQTAIFRLSNVALPHPFRFSGHKTSRCCDKFTATATARQKCVVFLISSRDGTQVFEKEGERETGKMEKVSIKFTRSSVGLEASSFVDHR